ncbi:MAG: hypothetical protein ACRD3W_03020, partial [Terriglobales bacterium]
MVLAPEIRQRQHVDKRSRCAAFFESGEVLPRYLRRRFADGPVVPLQLQVFECGYLDHTRSARSSC